MRRREEVVGVFRREVEKVNRSVLGLCMEVLGDSDRDSEETIAYVDISRISE
jgi:hypothetical protein